MTKLATNRRMHVALVAMLLLHASAEAQVLDGERPAGRLEPKPVPAASAAEEESKPLTPADQDLFGRGARLDASPAEVVTEEAEDTAEETLAEASATVHLASYRNAGDAMAGWAILRTRYAEMLSLYDPILSEVDLGARGRFIRLLAGPIAGEGTADDICRALKDDGAYCVPADFAGTPQFARKGG
ncbi:MAG: hypothetical protein V2I43_16235 [Parvularcula sp.]|jgi:hypothetical protein|nr:hypothetical protein [Parvularcula sp.]